ncbi:MAG: YopX family protein [Candidatus Nanoarchaeia archaeon]|nr:YopX family protein [Candidatus Nanoarchaeia archaeon]
MKEHKFMVWDKESKKMIFAKDIITQSIPCQPTKFGFKLKSKFILREYIGRKDKNGKEIYSGDILFYITRVSFTLIPGGGRKKEIHKFFCVVKWDEDKCGFNLFDKFGCRHTNLIPEINRMKIISNIYENPNGLKNETGKLHNMKY